MAEVRGGSEDCENRSGEVMDTKLAASTGHEERFRKTFRLQKEFEFDPVCQAAFEYAAKHKLYGDEMNFIGAVIERIEE